MGLKMSILEKSLFSVDYLNRMGKKCHDLYITGEKDIYIKCEKRFGNVIKIEKLC